MFCFWMKGGAGPCWFPGCTRESEYWFEDIDNRRKILYACCREHHPPVGGRRDDWTFDVDLPIIDPPFGSTS